MVPKNGTVTCLTLQDHGRKKKGTSRRKYDADFKAEVLKMVTNGQSVSYIFKALGVSENIIYCWKQKTEERETSVLGIDSASLSVENQPLKEQVRQLETEREILKKALARL